MILPETDTPADVTAAVNHYAGLLRLDPWVITLKVADTIGDDPGTEGQSTINCRYWSATLEFRRNMIGKPEWLTLVIHELLHVRMAEQYRAVDSVIHMLGVKQPKFQDTARGIWEDGNEPAIEALSRILADLFPKPPDQPIAI